MPTLMYTLPKEAQKGLSPPSAWGGMDERCRKVRIRLMPGRGGECLVRVIIVRRCRFQGLRWVHLMGGYDMK